MAFLNWLQAYGDPRGQQGKEMLFPPDLRQVGADSSVPASWVHRWIGGVGVRFIRCHQVQRVAAQPDKEVGPRCGPRRVGLKVHEVGGRRELARPHGVHALANYISKVLKNRGQPQD